MNLTPEQKARVDIDAALVAAGWILQNRDAINLAAGPGVAVREAKMASGHGFADYLLFVNGKAVGAIEAKPVTARKDDAPAAHQAALAKVADRGTFCSGGGLIHITSG